MQGYLETMGVPPLAIEAHEKGEAEHDTIHEITLTESNYKIHKMSRVNDLTLDLILGQEHTKVLEPGSRVKKTLAMSEHKGHVQVVSIMPTMNGVAQVTDIKTLVQEPSGSSSMVQKLIITNQQTSNSHTTIRYYIPHTGKLSAPAATAGGNNRDRFDEFDNDEMEEEED